MEVILIEDVKTLGKKGDLVKVNDGYGRNFIIPKKLGIEASKKNIAELERKKVEEAKRQQAILEEAQVLGKDIESKLVKIGIKAGEGGRTFGSVSSKEIAGAIKEQLNLDIDKKKLILSESLKNVGEYKVPIKLHPKVTAELKVIVEAV